MMYETFAVVRKGRSRKVLGEVLAMQVPKTRERLVPFIQAVEKGVDPEAAYRDGDVPLRSIEQFARDLTWRMRNPRESDVWERLRRRRLNAEALKAARASRSMLIVEVSRAVRECFPDRADRMLHELEHHLRTADYSRLQRSA